MSWQHESVCRALFLESLLLLESLSAVPVLGFVICSAVLFGSRAYFKSIEPQIRDPSAWVLKTCKREIETHLGLNNVIE